MFVPQFFPVIGGAERQAEKLGKALIDQGMTVEVHTPKINPGSETFEIRNGLTVRRFELHDISLCVGIKGIGILNAPYVSLQIAGALWKAVGQADIVHCHIGSLQTISVAIVARLRGKPVICKAAMADATSDLGEMARSTKLGTLLARIGRVAFVRWIATTDAVRSALIRGGVEASKIEIIPNGVEVKNNEEPLSKSEVRRFLYLGRLSSNIQRDVPGLIEAFDRIADNEKEIELAIIGDGDLLEATRLLVAKCRNRNRIEVPGSDTPEKWLQWADAFVLPSKREGLSNALLEAMSFGLPCIAADIPPNREVLGEGSCGILYESENNEDLQRKMEKLIANNRLAQNLGLLASKRVRSHYSLRSVATRYITLYEKLVLHINSRSKGQKEH